VNNYVKYGENNNHYKHGQSETKLYMVWASMKQRCNNPNSKVYERYGGRGITMYQDWDSSFHTFYTWAIETGYTEGLEIDRINNDQCYEPSNCRWVTSVENNRNKSSTILDISKAKEIRKMYKTGKYTQKTIGDKFNVSLYAISDVIRNKTWSI